MRVYIQFTFHNYFFRTRWVAVGMEGNEKLDSKELNGPERYCVLSSCLM